jgi:hypothetical protein
MYSIRHGAHIVFIFQQPLHFPLAILLTLFIGKTQPFFRQRQIDPSTKIHLQIFGSTNSLCKRPLRSGVPELKDIK